MYNNIILQYTYFVGEVFQGRLQQGESFITIPRRTQRRDNDFPFGWFKR